MEIACVSPVSFISPSGQAAVRSAPHCRAWSSRVGIYLPCSEGRLSADSGRSHKYLQASISWVIISEWPPWQAEPQNATYEPQKQAAQCQFPEATNRKGWIYSHSHPHFSTWQKPIPESNSVRKCSHITFITPFPQLLYSEIQSLWWILFWFLSFLMITAWHSLIDFTLKYKVSVFSLADLTDKGRRATLL